MKSLVAIGVVLLSATVAIAAVTNSPIASEIEGRALASRLLESRPESSFTNTGKLVVRAPKKRRVEVDYECRVIVTATNWTSHYSARMGTSALPGFSVIHQSGVPPVYLDERGKGLVANAITGAFAGTDFSIGDLGLDFLNWPEQRVTKWEMKRSLGCKVLESRNPAPVAGGYSKVLSWIHEESGALIQAEACDERGKLLKEFRPTETAKVNGRRELKEMEIENVQTGSRTTLVFDLNGL